MSDNKTMIKIISNCRSCPCFVDEYDNIQYSRYFCNLQEPTKPSPKMEHDVDKAVDPRCLLLNANYTLSLK